MTYNERIKATVEFQAPSQEYRDPASSFDKPCTELVEVISTSLIGRNVCPFCKRETDVFLVSCDGHVLETNRCRAHGDVPPMRSHIVNPENAP
ncbi:MAG: hypothetical protein IPL99_12145 [Candidatus Competibacteraceae bacterium]|nr:hypothetical protein [Candidatus Competibacteraceae bacterium]